MYFFKIMFPIKGDSTFKTNLPFFLSAEQFYVSNLFYSATCLFLELIEKYY